MTTNERDVIDMLLHKIHRGEREHREKMDLLLGQIAKVVNFPQPENLRKSQVNTETER